MTLLIPNFDDVLVVREADAEVLGLIPLSTRLLADSDATGAAQYHAHNDGGRHRGSEAAHA